MKLEISGAYRVAKAPKVLIFLLVTAALAWCQTPASAPAGCTKNVSFAIAESGQPVPAIPKFAVKWIDKLAHQPESKTLCFSQIPSSIMSNYLVIFSSSEAAFEGLTPSAHTYTSTKAGPGDTNTVSSYGGTWSYSYVGTPPPNTTTTLDLRRDDKPKSLFVRAYNQQGRVISKYSLGGFFSKEKVLEYVFTNILSDATSPQKTKSVPVPLSVYYVNCDVDSPPVETASESTPAPAAASAASAPAPPVSAPKDAPTPRAAPKAVLDIWSEPAGAEVSVDGGYVGKTPYSLSVPPGEHVILLRKRDFGTWQRRLQVDVGEHRVGTYLEQKAIALDFPPPPPGSPESKPSASTRGDSVSAAPVFEFWSIPTGADIVMDGETIGTTPYSLTVSPGEHTVIISKREFGTWQGKVQASTGKRRVGANLQRKTMTLQ
jgi:hypothetical protein